MALNAIFGNVVKKRTTSCMALLILLVSCAEENGTTIRVDPETGSYWLQPGDQALGPMGLVVNGSHALEGAFLFHGADSLVAISSLGELDLIAIFKGTNTGGSVHLILINTGLENQVIKQVKMFNLVLEEGFGVAGMKMHQLELEGSSLPAEGFCL
jgi:hypothetical protein